MQGEAFPASLSPVEAIAWFRAKGFLLGYSWQDVWHEEHSRAFTVAKAMTRDVLETIRAAVDRAIAEGETLDQFRKALRPRLEAAGWWGRQPMIDPATGRIERVQLGSPRRLKTIFQVNMRTAQAAGRWEQIERNKRSFPFLEYVSVLDGRTRPEHHAWHGTVLPVDDPWWDTHYPPNGWNCRCLPKPVSRGMAERRGLVATTPPRFPARQWVNKRTGEVHRIEQGIDPGWAYHVGKAHQTGLTPDPYRPGPDQGDGLAAMSAVSAERKPAISALSSTDEKALTPFFAAFGLRGRAAMVRGRSFTDAGGWPLAIAASWFGDGGGGLVLPVGIRAGDLAAVAAAIAAPEEIRWLWIAGDDGRRMLVRRYFGAPQGDGRIAVVDVARFWRAALVRPERVAALRKGVPAWPDALAAASYDPSQPRFAKGGPRGGEWRGTGRTAARASLLGNMAFFPKALFGKTGDEVASLADKQGLDIRDKGIALIHTQAAHILAGHGSGAEWRLDQMPVSGRDILRAPQLLNAATQIELGDAKRSNRPRFLARTGDFVSVWEVGKKNVTLITMWRKKEG